MKKEKNTHRAYSFSVVVVEVTVFIPVTLASIDDAEWQRRPITFVHSHLDLSLK